LHILISVEKPRYKRQKKTIRIAIPAMFAIQRQSLNFFSLIAQKSIEMRWQMHDRYEWTL